MYKVQSAFTRTLRNLSRFFLFLGDSLFSIPEVVRFVKNFFQSFFQIFEPFFLFSELFRPPPLPKQLIQYIKPKAVCQELFSSFFSFFRRALPQLVYYTISPSTLSSPPSPFLSITTFVSFSSRAICYI